MYWCTGEGTDLKVVVVDYDNGFVVATVVDVKFMTICYVEGVDLRLAKGCDRIDLLTPYKQIHVLKLRTIQQLRTVVLWFDKGSGREASPGWVQGKFFWRGG
jgi:hypothetical protein